MHHRLKIRRTVVRDIYKINNIDKFIFNRAYDGFAAPRLCSGRVLS